MRAFDFVVGAEASRKVIELAVDEQWDALDAFQTIADHPSTASLPHWTGEDGRTRYLRSVRGWMITFGIDHAERTIRILDVERP